MIVDNKKEVASSSIIKALTFVIGTYILLILSAGLVILVGVGVIYLLTILGEKFNVNPGGIIIAIGLGMAVGVLSMLKGILHSLRPQRPFHPAFVLKKKEHPKLYEFIHELCSNMNTKMPRHIILHAEPTFFVQQGKASTFSHTIRGRILAIGMPMLSFLEINELRAVLVHEFAHFTGKDTAYSSYILPVYESTLISIRNMAMYTEYEGSNNSAGWMALPMIIPSVILGGYYKLFNLSNMSRSRQREKRADIIACNTCGSGDFKNALIKSAGMGRIFANNSLSQIIDLYKQGKVYTNYYSYLRDNSSSVSELITEYNEDLMLENTDPNDAHPCLKDRLSYLPYVSQKFNTKGNVIDLINNAEEYEKSLTESYTEYIAIISDIKAKAV
jgi:Zn-dependent protease with chaperone function